MKRTKAVADLNMYLRCYFQLVFEKQDLVVQIGSMNLGKLLIVQAGCERCDFNPVIVCHIFAF